jgi:hypothetical protein
MQRPKISAVTRQTLPFYHVADIMYLHYYHRYIDSVGDAVIFRSQAEEESSKLLQLIGMA